MTDSLPEPSLAELDFVALLAALADPIRLKTVQALAEHGEISCTQVGVFAGLEVGKSTLSHHFKVLREAGLVHSRSSGKNKLMSLRRKELEEGFPGLLDAVLAGAYAQPRATPA